MAALEHHHEVLFNALKAIWTNDSNKLGAGAVSQGVREFLRAGDPLNTPAVPYIVVDIRDEKTDAGTSVHVDCVATLVLYSQRNLAHTEQNAIAMEIQRLYNAVNINSTGTDWKFGRCYAGHFRQIEPMGDFNRYAVEIRAIGYRNDGTNLQQLLGAQGTITWTPGGSSGTIYIAQCEAIAFRPRAEQTFDFRWSGAGSTAPAVLVTGSTIVLRVKVSSGTGTGPYIPDGVNATVSLYKDGSNGAVKWDFSAVVVGMDMQIDRGPEGGRPQSALYECRSVGLITESR